MVFEPDDLREMERVAGDLRALTSELADPADEVREIDLAHFRAEIDGDEEGKERAIAELSALRERYRVEGLFSKVLGSALAEANGPLALVALEGMLVLARQKLARGAGDEATDEGGGEV